MNPIAVYPIHGVLQHVTIENNKRQISSLLMPQDCWVSMIITAKWTFACN